MEGDSERTAMVERSNSDFLSCVDIVHGDVKPENALVFEVEDDESERQSKMGWRRFCSVFLQISQKNI